MSQATLIDTTKCVGCRSCQVSCKQWNVLPGELTQLGPTLQNPPAVSARTLTVVTYNEVADDKAPGGLHYVFAKRQCMHCNEPACAAACPVTAMHKTAQGPVIYDEQKCIGCRYCVWACPFGAPAADWDTLAPRIHKCDFCFDRTAAKAGEVPACVKQCPAGALEFGERTALLQRARARIAESPGKYVDHIYGEHEAGGTGMLYLSAVPLTKVGFPEVGTQSYPKRAIPALSAVPPAAIGVAALLGGAVAVRRREKEVKHVEFSKVEEKPKRANHLALLMLMAFGAISALPRVALGLGASTNLSDTFAWGLWIVFDLVWIALAAGAFVTAGLIYVFKRKDLYSIGRSAVLLGLLSYSFVMVTLIADLGLPWHFFELALQRPEHSAMFEVSWCVGLYVTVLALEFAPVPLHWLRRDDLVAKWRKWSPRYVVAAMTLFVWLMSGKVAYAAAAAVVMGFLAWAFRDKPGEDHQPVLLAIAAVTLSTMHQSSLGSLFLLMPDKLSKLWWTPMLPIEFFLSSIAAGTAVMTLVQLWIQRAFGRPARASQLATLSKVSCVALSGYLAVRLADVLVRGAHDHGKLALFVAESAATALAAALLAVPKIRRTPRLAGWASALAAGSIVFHRVNVVWFAMHLRGPMANRAAAGVFVPSVFEWGLSVGLVAVAIFLFAQAVRRLPVLPAAE